MLKKIAWFILTATIILSLNYSALSQAKSFTPRNVSDDTDIPWPTRDYRAYYPLPDEDIDQAERTYWQQWTTIIDEGISNRGNIQDQLSKTQDIVRITKIKNIYWQKQNQMIDQLSQIEPPERLRNFHNFVVAAARDQIDFYVDYSNAKADNGQIKYADVYNNAHLKSSDQKLWDAYHQFVAVYPQRSQKFNTAIEMRLCSFDIADR